MLLYNQHMRFEKEEKEHLPFFIIVAAAMVFLYCLTVINRPDLRMPPAIIIFSMIMAVHTVLHWFYTVFARDRRRLLLYFFVQTVIAVTAVYYTGEVSLVFGLLLPLIGEEAGIFRGIKSVLIIILINTLIILVLLWALFREGGFNPLFFAGVIPMIFFVIVYVDLYSRQSEAKRRAEQLLSELETVNAKLRESNLQVEQLTLEQERQRMARELHDTLAQGLSGLVLQLEAARAHLDGQNPQRADEIVGRALQKARETLAGARLAIDGLRSRSGTKSFMIFLSEQAGNFAECPGMNYRYSAAENVNPEGPQRSSLEKIVSELLLNCIRHSGAASVNVDVVSANGSIKLSVSDDGKGFDPDNVPDGHYGLKGIAERCEMFGGSLTIKTAPGKGAVITVLLPVPGTGGAADV